MTFNRNFLLTKFKKSMPHRVKPQEQDRVNPAFSNLSKGDCFSPVIDVDYIWVYTEDEEIIVGIEEAWKYPHAFNFSVEKWRVVSLQMENAGSLGHPTLTNLFNFKSGITKPSQGKAFIGGEMRYVDGVLLVNNTSGRFGRIANESLDVFLLMHDIAEKITHYTKIPTKIRIKLPKATYLEAYYVLWEKEENAINSALTLLTDYYTKVADKPIQIKETQASSQEKQWLQDILTNFTKEKPSNIESLLVPFQSNYTSLNQELKNRLDFIAGHENVSFFPHLLLDSKGITP
jgi:hypothetical protein